MVAAKVRLSSYPPPSDGKGKLESDTSTFGGLLQGVSRRFGDSFLKPPYDLECSRGEYTLVCLNGDVALFVPPVGGG